ncbi:MAG TPA: NUDIX domain-containing protein [Chitinophagaceae bacterium]|jgi:predicted NUDIX family NTP pyrophosphohydrolase|nr:NUDIX domain-containing protein [Chitinophagaceae bacterium]
MPKQSAGILVYRTRNNGLEIFLCHPGGPFYKNKDTGVWSIPKGELDNQENPLAAARREFKEETGQEINGEFVPLKPIKYKNGKIVHAWAVEGDVDVNSVQSNLFPLEWPPKSGKYIDVPEVDKGEWFIIEIAKQKILPVLNPLLEELQEKIVR